eukprot:g6507.t1
MQQWPKFRSCFNDSSRDLKLNVWSKDDSSWLTLLNEQYNASSLRQAPPFTHKRNPSSTSSWRIPRIIHHIWLGSALPSRFIEFRKKWIASHPEWQCILWGDEEAKLFPLKNREAFENATNYGEKSDILRYEILLRYGGVYLDVDMECLQSLDYFHLNFKFYAGISNTATVELNNAIIGSCPQHPIIKKCVEKIKNPPENTFEFNFDNTTANQALSIALMKNSQLSTFLARKPPKMDRENPMYTICFSGPGMFTRTVMEYVIENNNRNDESSRAMIILPPTFFFPLPNNTSTKELNEKFCNREESFTVHHWACTWKKNSKK